MAKPVKKKMAGGLLNAAGRAPAQAAGGMAKAAGAAAGRGNAGGAMRGADRAAAMSGRAMKAGGKVKRGKK